MKAKFFAILLALLATGLIASTINYSNPTPMNPQTGAPNDKTYEKQWKEVEELISKGLPKSALEIVEEIYQDARKKNNSPQFIKAVLYKMRLISNYEEDFLVKVIDDLRQDIESSDIPDKQLLHSILAEVYWGYYQKNRYRFLERTTTSEIQDDDILTWDLNKILEKIIGHYMASLENSEKLKKIRIDKFEAILQQANGSDEYRPTLYDFLAHRAVDFFMNDESAMNRPSYRFEIDETKYFDPAGEFAKLNLKTKDSLSLKFHALLIMQDLIAFHLDDEDPAPLIDADLKRLNFVYNNAILPNLKDSLYLSVLQNLEKKHISDPASTDVSYQIAQTYNSLGEQYDPLSSENHKWDKKKAYETCLSAMNRFPDSKGAKNCKSLLKQIEKKSLSLQTESVNIPRESILALLNFKNVEKAHFRILELDYKKYNEESRGKRNVELIKEYLLELKPLADWTENMPVDGDYQQHAVQVALPDLEPGYYAVLVGSDPDFKTDEETVAYASFFVSDISYINHRSKNGDQEFYLLNRKTGEAMPYVQAYLYEEKYDYRSREYSYKELGSYQADENGYMKLPIKNLNRKNFTVKFIHKYDTLWSESLFYSYHYDNEPDDMTVTYFFTDRKIYRPGQSIYFKGIMLQKTGDAYEIKPETKTTVTFYDVNHQEISSLDLMTNEYGSFHGTFTAPQGVLNGSMRIENNSGAVDFRVEDYKRPKFEVTFEPITGTYKLGEEVEVTGKAKAYAGNPIDHADVKYRVVRETSFPIWRFWYRPWPASPDMEIENGTAKTDENGEFKIDFKAIPDKNISRKNYPVFRYRVYADVTDINGETHSNETVVSVGYNALLIDLGIPEKFDPEKTSSFSVNTTNLNGEDEPAELELQIFKLKEPDRLMVDRKWNRPDKFIMTKEEFVKLFPHDIYDDENNPDSRERQKKVFDKTINTADRKKTEPENLSNWKAGTYVALAKTTDEFDKEVETKKYFEIYHDDNDLEVMDIRWFTPLKTTGEPGEKAAVFLGSKADVRVLFEVILENKVIKREWIELKNEKMKLEVPIKEEYRGNFGLSLSFVKYNRIFQNIQNITVPYTNKELQIEFATFRDKLKPGQKEEWQITIKGPKGEEAAAEMLATMYDASLDVFAENSWHFNLYPSRYISLNWNNGQNFGIVSSRSYENYSWTSPIYQSYDKLNWFGFSFYGRYRVLGMGAGEDRMEAPMKMSEVEVVEDDSSPPEEKEAAEPDQPDKQPQAEKETTPVQVRKDFRETAFFYPDLKTNEDGEIVLSFSMPEALTRWKMLGLAYTKDLKVGKVQKELVTQKELMVVPNQPRFFREGDTIMFSSKIASLVEKDLSGEVEVQFFNSLNMKPIDDLLQLKNAKKDFKLEAGQSASASWQLIIPEGLQAITYRIIAKAGNFSDGEEMAILVLPNRMLVTESLPLPVRGEETKEFEFEKLVNSADEPTLSHYRLTLEFTSNPAWYAVQALPYLMEYPYECSEQVFSRFYANSLATHIANSSPKIKQVFESWKDLSPEALLSNLEKNQELKSVLLEETPWVRQAKNESERKRRIALLFDLNKMSYELENALLKLQQMQSSNGGWPWFEGMRDNRYITQHIVTGMGHLKHLKVADIMDDKKTSNMIREAVLYLDDRIRKDYEELKKNRPDKMDEDQIGQIQIQYLYARSFFKDEIELRKSNQEAFQYYRDQASKFWVEKNIYMQGMISLALNRYGLKTTPSDIIKSLKERSLHSEEMGMYWRNNNGWYWYQAPIERQALLIEAFDEVANDLKSVEEMKIWLLKQKQTQSWETTKATTEAVYALILRGTDLLESDELVEITLGSLKIDPAEDLEIDTEAGTGYFKKSWSASQIKPSMGDITVTKNDPGIAWGALYWQYFQDLDKITPHETPLSLEKKLFVEKNTDRGPVIQAIEKDADIEIGDKVIVRIILRSDRDMEYIHLKDMRASSLEPVNVLSGYKWQDGLGYYESTRDASTNFFMDYLPRGTYVFEYPLIASQAGDFSNGIATIQCMYAPEFTSHSEGIRVSVQP